MKTNRLLIIIIVALVIIGIVTFTNFLSFSNMNKINQDQIRENQLTKTRFVADRIENHIHEVKEELITLSKFPIMKTLDINTCSGDMRIVHEKIEGKIDSLLRVDEKGNIIECSAPQFEDYVGLNIQNKDYFKIPKEEDEPYISGLVNQGGSQQIIISAPLFETTEYTPYPNFVGQFQGLVLSIIELDNLYLKYIHPLETDSIFFILFDKEGQIIMQNLNIPENISLKGLVSQKEDINLVADFGSLGETIITSSDIYFEEEIWTLVFLTPLKDITAEISSIQKRHIFSLALVGLLILLAVFFLVAVYKSHEKLKSKLDKTTVTLEKLGISIDVEKEKFSQADIQLEPHKLYLIKEGDENHAHELFISTLNRGYAGLGIVREDPRVLKKKYNLEKTSFIWLTKTKVEGIPTETRIEELANIITEFVKKSQKSVIIIDRLDYLFSENDENIVLQQIRALKDLAISADTIIILSLNSELLPTAHLEALESETIDLYGKHLKQNLELSDMERGILQLINEKNVTSSLISYKDITTTFNITKPTTRSKIRKLQQLGLVQVEQKGRFKSLKITSMGRRIIG